MSRAPTERLGHDQQSQGASLREARLGGIAGRGTLQVLRNGSGARVSVEGTWRPADEDAPLGPLLHAAADGETVRFEGTIDDTTRPDPEPVDVEVQIRSHGVYRFETRSELGDVAAGEHRHVFNFEPVREEVRQGV